MTQDTIQQEIEKKALEIANEYAPHKGCDNCCGDLHQGCTDACRRELDNWGECYRAVKQFLESIATTAREEVLKEKNEILDALLDMYQQYCGDQYGHRFMSAGENASSVLEKYGIADFDEAGRIITNNKTE